MPPTFVITDRRQVTRIPSRNAKPLIVSGLDFTASRRGEVKENREERETTTDQTA